MGEVAWTQWSVFEELRIKFDNPVQPDSVTEQEWNDTFFVAAGATYRHSEDLVFRAGVAYDETPIPDATRTPRIPGADRYWTAVGADHNPAPWLSLNASFTHIFVDDGDVNLSATDPGNRFRGNYRAEYDNAIDIITVSAKVKF